MSFYTGFACEYVFWNGLKTSVDGVAEPVSAASGFVLCFFGLFGMPMNYKKMQLPIEFYLAKASLFICGVGTMLYHYLDRDDNQYAHVNSFVYDGVTMAFVVMNMCVLFCYFESMMVAILAMAYILFWVMSNDTVTYDYLQYATNGSISTYIQYPLFVLPFVFLLGLNITFIKQSRVPLIILLSVAVSAWLIDRFVCNEISALAFAHSVWHCFVGYAADLFIVIGLKVRLENTPKNNLIITGNWWPVLEKRPETEQYNAAYIKVSL